MKKINIGYSRVSTQIQAEEGYSLNYQKGKILEFFEKNNIEEYEMVSDEGISGTNLKRPGIMKVLSLIKENKVSRLVVHKNDRISRDIIDFNKIIKLCRQYKVIYISITDDNNFKSAMGRGMSNVSMAFSQMELEIIKERTKNGVKAKVELGQYPYSGCPLGYVKTENHILIETEEKKIVKEIFDLRLTNTIAETMRQIENKYQLGRSKDFYSNIVKRTIYYGYVTVDGKRYNLVDPIIEEEKYMKKFKNRKYRKRKNYQKKKGNYKYGGKVFYNNIQMNQQTKVKKLKNGKKLEYKYYYLSKSKGKSIYINENDIDMVVLNYIIEKEEKIQKEILIPALKCFYKRDYKELEKVYNKIQKQYSGYYIEKIVILEDYSIIPIYNSIK